MSDAYTLQPPTTRITFEVNAGDTLNALFPVLDDDCAPVEITPAAAPLWSARSQVRRNVHAAEVLHEWTTSGAAPNAEIVPGNPGLVRLRATAVETAAWQSWVDFTCGWDLDVIEPAVYGGATYRIAEGPFLVRPEYTR